MTGRFEQANLTTKACWVCGDTTGKCRRIQRAGYKNPVHLCMTYNHYQKGDIVKNLKCSGPTANGVWGIFVDVTPAVVTGSSRPILRARPEPVRVPSSPLSPAERDDQYCQLLGSLSLHPDDALDLKKRGYTNKMIAIGRYASIPEGGRLRTKVDEQTPGVLKGGQRLVVQRAGYLCPMWDIDGYIVGCQVRLRSPDEGTGRYRWLSAPQNGYTPHFSFKDSYEMPLTVLRPHAETSEVALVEGVGAKPFLAAHRLSNAAVLGAAGGLFASSPTILSHTLNTLSEQTEQKNIIIYPDAGDVKNPHVWQRQEKLFTLLHDWGYSVDIAWWGQTDKPKDGNKAYGDIDECADSVFETRETLSPSAYLALTQGRQR